MATLDLHVPVAIVHFPTGKKKEKKTKERTVPYDNVPNHMTKWMLLQVDPVTKPEDAEFLSELMWLPHVCRPKQQQSQPGYARPSAVEQLAPSCRKATTHGALSACLPAPRAHPGVVAAAEANRPSVLKTVVLPAPQRATHRTAAQRCVAASRGMRCCWCIVGGTPRYQRLLLRKAAPGAAAAAARCCARLRRRLGAILPAPPVGREKGDGSNPASSRTARKGNRRQPSQEMVTFPVGPFFQGRKGETGDDGSRICLRGAGLTHAVCVACRHGGAVLGRRWVPGG